MLKDPALSLVVATRGRAQPFEQLFASLQAQAFRDFEVVIVDQNADDRVGPIDAQRWSFPITHMRTPKETGLSRARNSGLELVRGKVVLFPDDDCWYPADFLLHAMVRMEALGADVLAGRAADEHTGRDINGRFEPTTTRITRNNVFTTGIEWVVFFKRAVLDAVGGYDVDVGVGASTPWQACEGQEIMLRALARGFCCYFDPTVYGHHAELDIRDAAMLKKGRGYARGLGFVLRKHGFSNRAAMRWLLRPAARAVLSLMKGDRTLFAYYRNVVVGRYEGWTMKAAQAPAAASTGRHAIVKNWPHLSIGRSHR